MKRDISVRPTEMTRPVKMNVSFEKCRNFGPLTLLYQTAISQVILSVTSTRYWFLKWLMPSCQLGSSNYHDDGNENVKKAVTLIQAKQQLCTSITKLPQQDHEFFFSGCYIPRQQSFLSCIRINAKSHAKEKPLLAGY